MHQRPNSKNDGARTKRSSSHVASAALDASGASSSEASSASAFSSSESSTSPAPTGGLGLLILMLACSFMASFGQSMVNIALPEVADRFSVTLSMANWLIVGYTVVAATSITLAAFLLGRLGLRKLFFIAGGALALGSGLALVAPDFPTLLGCRFLQAVGTGLFYPTVTSVVTAASPPQLLGVRLALNSGVIAVGLAVSPVVSGLVLTYFGWNGLFVVPFALAVTLLVVGFFLVRDLSAANRGKPDLPSAVMSLVGLGALVYGLGEVARDPLPSSAVIVAGLVVIALFVRRQLKLKTPLLNVRPLAHPRFAVGIALVMLGTMASFSLSVLLPLYYEGAEGRTAFFAGLLLLGPVLVDAVLAFAGGKLYDRRGLWPLVPAGFVLTLLGQIGVIVAAGGRVTWVVVAASAVVYAGIGFISSPSKTAALQQLPPDLLPHGAAINSTFVQIANAIGSALFVGVLSSDVLHAAATGLAKPEAYAAGFAHTLILAAVLTLVGLALSTPYARTLRNHPHSQKTKSPRN